MLNKAIVQGRLARDPEMRTSTGGLSWTSFSVACQRNFKGSDGNRDTDFISVVAWRKTAEFIYRYFKKGDLIIVEGSLQTRTYDDNKGVKHYVTEIVADQVNFCGGKNDDSGSNAAPSTPAPQSLGAQSEDDDGDLPF